jgi:hypothetical protein
LSENALENGAVLGKLHDVIIREIVLEPFVEVGDKWMMHLLEEVELTGEAGDRGRVADRRFRENFDRGFEMGELVKNKPDRGERAGPKGVLENVGTDLGNARENIQWKVR